MRIVGIHGIGNLRAGQEHKKAADELSALWSTYLSGRGVEDDVRVVYYADLLQEKGHQGEDGRLEDLSEAEAGVLADVLAQQAPPADAAGVAQGWLTYPLRAQLDDIVTSKACSSGLMEWFMVRFAKEVAHYLRPSPARRMVQERVRQVVTEHRPDVVIAHSLGSVVAYEALHTLKDEARVPLLVTLGSPLALPKAVFPKLVPRPEGNRGRKPDSVRRWANIADHGDIVALPIGGVSRRFDGIESDQRCSAHATFRFHHVEQYLKTAALTALLDTFPAGDEQPA